MSVNSSSKHFSVALKIVGLIFWVAFSVFVVPMLLISLVVGLLSGMGIDTSFLLDSAAGVLGLYGLQFVIGFLVMMTLPLWNKKFDRQYISKLLGIDRAIKSIDIGYGTIAFLGYMVMTIALQAVVIMLWTGYDAQQAQQLGFSLDAAGLDLVLAGIGLVILAPVFEELIFRGYLFSQFRRYLTFPVTALLVSLVFAVAHMQVNVGLDVFVLSLWMCFVREKTGSVWGTILMHMIKNGLAFTLLFIVKVG